MQQNEYTENLFRSVDTIVAERIKNLSYDYTQLMEITDDNNANAGMYKVKLNSNTDVVAYADNPSYQTGDQVYVLNTGDGDRRFILGTFLKNSTGRIDRSNGDLLKLQNDVDNLLYSTEDLKASLLILPGQLRSEMQSLDRRFSSELEQTAQKFSMRFEDTEKKLESNFLMTAEMLRTEFSDELNGLHSTFLQTAGMFQTEVVDEFNQRWSRITQTADEIKSEVADDINGLYSVIDQTAGEIRSEVHDSVNDLHSLIDQTAGEIKLQVIDGLNSQQATLDILASGITARVEDMEKGYSEISQTADQISSKVESLYGNYSQILQTADQITSRVEGLYGNYSEIKQTADMISSRVEGIEGNYSEIIQTADMIQSRVEDVNGYASMIEQKANSIKLEVTDPTEDGHGSKIQLTGDGIVAEAKEIKFKGMVTFEDLDGTETIINGRVIETGTITADHINAEKFNVKIDGDGNEWNGKAGFLGYGQGSDGRNTTHGVMLAGPGGDNYFIATTAGVRMTCGSATNSPSFYVAGNGANVTNTSLTVGGAISCVSLSQTSDKKKKNSINYNISKYENFYDLLQPTSYKLNDEKTDRFHIGFIYQDVEKALLRTGLNSSDFAGLVKFHQEDDIWCGLGYTEFIALNTHMIQKTRKELEEKNNKIQQLENKIDELEQKLNLLLETLS